MLFIWFLSEILNAMLRRPLGTYAILLNNDDLLRVENLCNPNLCLYI